MTKRNKQSQKDLAREIARDLLESVIGNGAAVLFNLARQPRGVQKRVLDLLKRKKPSRKLLDPYWLSAIEAHRQEYGDRTWSDLKVIEHYLTHVKAAYGRKEGEPFRPNTTAGRAEVVRIRDALTRARRNRKKAAQKT